MTTAAHGALITVAAVCGGLVWVAGELAVWGATRLTARHSAAPADLAAYSAHIDAVNAARGY